MELDRQVQGSGSLITSLGIVGLPGQTDRESQDQVSEARRSRDLPRRNRGPLASCALAFDWLTLVVDYCNTTPAELQMQGGGERGDRV